MWEGEGGRFRDGDAEPLGAPAERRAAITKRQGRRGIEQAYRSSWRKAARATISAYKAAVEIIRPG